MSDFSARLKLKGKAEEDIYFSRKDRELIEALRKKRLQELAECDVLESSRPARSHEKRFRKITKKHRKHPRRLIRAYRKLIKTIRKHCRMRQRSQPS